MRIEIVPEGNKTRKDGHDWDFTTLFDAVFGSVGSIVEKFFEGIVGSMEAAVSGTIRRLVASIVAVIGLFLLFSGLSDMLDFMYGIPGIGGVVIGTGVFFVAVIAVLVVGRGR